MEPREFIATCQLDRPWCVEQVRQQHARNLITWSLYTGPSPIPPYRPGYCVPEYSNGAEHFENMTNELIAWITQNPELGNSEFESTYLNAATQLWPCEPSILE
jgi:hypothetical protein